MPKKIRIWANAKEKTLTENPSRSNALAPCIASEGMFEFLYENEFPDGFAMRARDRGFAWEDIIPALRNGRFFFFDNDYFAGPGANITGRPYLSQEDAVQLGGVLLHTLRRWRRRCPTAKRQ